MKNNKVVLIGKVVSEVWEGPAGPHYHIVMEVERTSGQVDVLPVYVPAAVDPCPIYPGDILMISGVYRSRNQQDESGSHLKLYVCAREIMFVNQPIDCTTNNYIYLQGYLCKPAVYRVTPKGREVADLLLAVNRESGITDYIPCIAWGPAAKFADSMKVGNLVAIEGRIQSRKYVKRINDIACDERTAYEISCRSLALVCNDEVI